MCSKVEESANELLASADERNNLSEMLISLWPVNFPLARVIRTRAMQ